MFWEPIIIEPDELKNIRFLTHSLRQDVINLACEIVKLRSQGKLKRKDEKVLFDSLHEKRNQLDDIERALSIAETYNHDLMEKREAEKFDKNEKEMQREQQKEERLQKDKEAIRNKKHRIQNWIENRDSRIKTDADLLKAILHELGTIRNWIIDPDEYENIQNSE